VIAAGAPATHAGGMYTLAFLLFLAATDPAPPQPVVTPQQAIAAAKQHARAGEREKAFESLKIAIDRGYGQSEALNADNDFLTLREDKRWTELFAAAQRNQHPCRNVPEYRQFDFWLGEWDVEIGGQRIGRSSIQLILDECVVFENFETQGYSGKSLNSWDAGKKRWEQFYTDTAGTSRHFLGKIENDRMVMTTEFDRNGTKVINRMTYSKEGADKVRQFIEISIDGGKTWSPGFDGMYVRRK
jgi:hypothetical protein